jgi:hypothetical protein
MNLQANDDFIVHSFRQYSSVIGQGQGAVDLTPNRGIARIEFGDIAQLGERCVRTAEVGGSNPPISTVPL